MLHLDLCLKNNRFGQNLSENCSQKYYASPVLCSTNRFRKILKSGNGLLTATNMDKPDYESEVRVHCQCLCLTSVKWASDELLPSQSYAQLVYPFRINLQITMKALPAHALDRSAVR